MTDARGRLDVDGLEMSFGAARVLSGVTFQVAPGERHGLIGVNGAGKTTLFNIIAGDLAPSAGSIRFDGRELGGRSVQERVLMGLGRTYQVSSLAMAQTVRANLVLSLGDGRLPSPWTPWRRASDDPRLRRVVEDLDLAEHLDTQVDELSHGVQRQLELAMVLHRDPEILLLDEPAAGLSPAERERLVSAIEGLPAGITLLMVEHDLDVIMKLCQRITVLHQGRILMSGTPQDVVANKTVRDVYLGVA